MKLLQSYDNLIILRKKLYGFFPIKLLLLVTVHCKNLRPAYFPRWKKFLSDDGPQRSFDLLKLTKIAGAGTYVDVTHAFQSHCMKVQQWAISISAWCSTFKLGQHRVVISKKKHLWNKTNTYLQYHFCPF